MHGVPLLEAGAVAVGEALGAPGVLQAAVDPELPSVLRLPTAVHVVDRCQDSPIDVWVVAVPDVVRALRWKSCES
jgi:hypothetical protein